MAPSVPHPRPLATLFLCVLLTACARAPLRIPGASTDFPATSTGFKASEPLPATIEVTPPIDARRAHYNETVAGTSWKGCATDAIWSGTASTFLQTRLNQEIADSQLFLPPSRIGSKHLILRSEIDAFCGQVAGFIYNRAAGIVAVKFSLIGDNKPLWESKIERVVRDNDPEYTGGQLVTVEQAMRTTTTDSLRLVLRDLLQEIDKNRAELRSALGD